MSGLDNVCIALRPQLCRRYTIERYKIYFDFLAWQADAADMRSAESLTSLSTLTTACYSHLSSEKLYREDGVCAVARPKQVGDHLTLKQYLAAEHLFVTTLPSVLNILDKQLAALGAKRKPQEQQRSSRCQSAALELSRNRLPIQEIERTTRFQPQSGSDRKQQMF